MERKTRERNRERKPGRAANRPAAGAEPMTAAQRSYLRTLSEESGVPFEGNLTRADAARRIAELQDRASRLKEENRKR